VYPLSIDDNFGRNTETALKAVQRFIGTSADGVYGPNTRNAMKFIDTENFPLTCGRFR
jgi:peptidoglycan hydrolase-like protein with peptidoglycan-binding domain